MSEDAPVVNSAVADALAAIAAEREAEEAAKAAAAEIEDRRVAELVAAKAALEEAVGPISAALAAAADERERQSLIELEARTAASFLDRVERANQELTGQSARDITAPGETFLTSSVSVLGDADA